MLTQLCKPPQLKRRRYLSFLTFSQDVGVVFEIVILDVEFASFLAKSRVTGKFRLPAIKICTT
jgi:hypothetical protein